MKLQTVAPATPVGFLRSVVLECSFNFSVRPLADTISMFGDSVGGLIGCTAARMVIPKSARCASVKPGNFWTIPTKGRTVERNDFFEAWNASIVPLVRVLGVVAVVNVPDSEVYALASDVAWPVDKP